MQFNVFSEEEAELRSKVKLDKDYAVKKVQTPNGEETLHLFDTGGQERYATMTQSYYRGADCCVCIFDKTNKASFDDIEKWAAELDRYAKEGTPRVLIGTKKDLPEVVTQKDTENLRRKLNIQYYYEISAKQGGEDIDKAFTEWLTKKWLTDKCSRKKEHFFLSCMNIYGSMNSKIPLV